MDCYIYTFIGLALLGGSILTMTVSKEQHNMLRTAFSKELANKYESIVAERRNHYMIGLGLGILLAYFISRNIKISKGRSKKSPKRKSSGSLETLLEVSNDFTRMALFLAVTLITALIFYLLMPKSDYMLNHLTTAEQNKKWLNMYRTMQRKYFMGMILGALATIPIAKSFCKL